MASSSESRKSTRSGLVKLSVPMRRYWSRSNTSAAFAAPMGSGHSATSTGPVSSNTAAMARGSRLMTPSSGRPP